MSPHGIALALWSDIENGAGTAKIAVTPEEVTL